MRSAHPEASRLIQKGLFTGLSSFSDFEARLKRLANTKQVGDAFEILVEALLQTQPTLQAANVWLVGQVPLRIRRQLNLPSDSKGIDGIFETRAGELVPYQVKYRTERDVLPYGEVSSFLGITERSCKDRLIVTNARALAKDVESRDGLRSVRAHHFHALAKEDFAAIEAWLTAKLVEHERRKPRPYQQEAIQKLTEALKNRPRATAVMACGTGKTLVALWVAEALEPKTVLVLVPSLALLSQTLPDWCRESKWSDSLEYLCVCSDPTVSRGVVDAYTIRPQDVDFPITTDAKEVRRFLNRRATGVKVVFSTYQSAPVVAEGLTGLKPFDFAVFDEAHKTTGPQAGLFSFGLSDKNLSAHKRLFLTATPRHYDIRRRDKEGDFRLVSMDDESVYGPVAYRLSFASAVKQGIICPYKIVISVTTKAEVDAELLKHGITLVERDKVQARWVATQLALQRATERAAASKVITFHSRVALAEEFASDRTSGVRQHLEGFEVFHVNGGQSAADRESLLNDFKASGKGLITNARCLTEGVDVPAVDMVAFIDPRRSKVDIAQATGRAMRQSKATGKTTGYIVVPLFLEQKKGESEEHALKRSGFEDVAMVIAAMQEQDEDLIDVIRELRQEKGEGKPFNPRLLLEKLEVVGPEISLNSLSRAIAVQVVERLGEPWDQMYGRLLQYARVHGTVEVPSGKDRLSEQYKLACWCRQQRTLLRKDRLLPRRHERLTALGFNFDPYAAQWEEGFERLRTFIREYGHADVSSRFPDRILARWVVKQRVAYRERRLDAERVKRLSSVSFNFVRKERDRRGRSYLPYREATLIAQSKRLGSLQEFQLWARGKRKQHGAFPSGIPRSPQIVYLDSGWTTWNDFLGTETKAARDERQWFEMYSRFREFVQQKGGGENYTDCEPKLRRWIMTQKVERNKGTLRQDRRDLLEAAGIVWDSRSAQWNNGFRHLLEFVRDYGTSVVVQSYKSPDGYPLGAWLAHVRAVRAELETEKIKQLEAMPNWTWRPISDRWNQAYERLAKVAKRDGIAVVPISYVEPDGFRLGTWVQVQRQRYKRGTITQKQVRLLESLDGWKWSFGER